MALTGLVASASLVVWPICELFTRTPQLNEFQKMGYKARKHLYRMDVELTKREEPMVIEIIRLEESEEGTFGIMKIDKEVFCNTLEPKDELNSTGISSIPAQQYIATRYSRAKYPDTFEITKVPGRGKILFHPGNTIQNTEGCILLGQYVGKLRGQRAVLNSGNTFADFMDRLILENQFHLTITEVY